MKDILLINLSPRQKGTSVVLAHMCKEHLEKMGQTAIIMHLYPNLNDLDNLCRAVEIADTIVLSGPCYINTYPADTIALLEELAKNENYLHGQNLYGMIQGGMPYAHTHESGLNMLKIFGNECNVKYKGGFVMGLGAMLNGQSVDKLINAKIVKRQLSVFFDHVNNGEESPSTVYHKAQMKFPSLLYRIMAGMMNRKIDKDLRSRGINANLESPYLS